MNPRSNGNLLAALKTLNIEKTWFDKAHELKKVDIQTFLLNARNEAEKAILLNYPLKDGERFTVTKPEDLENLDLAVKTVYKGIRSKLMAANTSTSTPNPASSASRQAMVSRTSNQAGATLDLTLNDEANPSSTTAYMIKLLDKEALPKVLDLYKNQIQSNPRYNALSPKDKASFDADYAPKTETRDGKRVTTLKFETMEQLQAFVAQLKQQGIKFTYVDKPVPEAAPATPVQGTDSESPPAPRRSP